MKVVYNPLGRLYQFVTSGREIQESASTKNFPFCIPETNIGGSQILYLYRFELATNEVVRIWTAGITNDKGDEPDKTFIQLYNETDGKAEYSTNVKFASGSPLEYVFYGMQKKDMSIRINNEDNDVKVHGFMTISWEITR